ncbi:MAG: UDP-glucose 4-epimerase GalE [Pseudohongiellaceae bacterium]
MNEILVVGGAGYIGSHMVKLLLRSGYRVTVLDDLSGGFRDAVPEGLLVEGSITDTALLQRLFARTAFSAVMHFASFIQVGESVADPAKYYANNVAATLLLLEVMRKTGVDKFIFSSTAAIYGDPQYSPIDEQHPKQPINPYGRSKWMVEQVLDDYDAAYGLCSVCLRYFNAAGADPDGALGERHQPETHLIPLILQAAAGRRAAISVFGSDYDTPDGTCIRDYIHVSDLCDAHLLALRHLLDGKASLRLNLGNGQGFSVSEVIAAARRVTGREFSVKQEQRRPGDPSRLVADASKARLVLGWQPRFAELDRIIADAWRWEQQHKWP